MIQLRYFEIHEQKMLKQQAAADCVFHSRVRDWCCTEWLKALGYRNTTFDYIFKNMTEEAATIRFMRRLDKKRATTSLAAYGGRFSPTMSFSTGSDSSLHLRARVRGLQRPAQGRTDEDAAGN